MRVAILVIAIAIAFLAAVAATPKANDFEFAKRYTVEELLSDPSARDKFMRDVFFWEGFFHMDGVALNLSLGITFDGTGIDPKSGSPDPSQRHDFSAASKEFIHLGLMAWALNGNDIAQLFFQQSAKGMFPF